MSASTLDPAALQVLIARLTGVAEEMAAVVRRASFSPNIKERADFSCALFTAAGDLLVQAENIPVHLGSMPASVAVAVERFGASIEPGQQVLLNDPFDGGTHLNELTLVLPCFDGGALVGWAANRAHHADVGGSAPGSLPADATEVYQEGLRIPPVSQRVADVCLGALAQALPGRVGAASQGTMNNLLLGGADWVYYETVAGGQGGRPGRAGMSGVHTAMTNTKNTPVEAFERAYPLRVRRLRLWAGSGGAAEHPGGDGVERDIELLAPATLSLITERRRSQPWGLQGGQPGRAGENWLLPGGDEARAEPLPDKVTRPLPAGDVVRLRTPGGGGWGRAAPA
jgi:N-methylhydantoinase B/oxoprolinase/acetone carboxylase alpha subunit